MTKNSNKLKLTAIIFTINAPSIMAAGIPQPDVLIFGTITIDGAIITANDSVTVIARAPGVADPVGKYKMGDLDTAGDRYAVRVRLESLVPGTTVSSDSVSFSPGDTRTVNLFVKQGSGKEQPTGSPVTITQQGALVSRNISVGSMPSPGDFDNDHDVDLLDFGQFQICFTGQCPSTPCKPPLYSNPNCAHGDFDNDGDVDLIDFGQFQVAFTG